MTSPSHPEFDYWILHAFLLIIIQLKRPLRSPCLSDESISALVNVCLPCVKHSQTLIWTFTQTGGAKGSFRKSQIDDIMLNKNKSCPPHSAEEYSQNILALYSKQSLWSRKCIWEMCLTSYIRMQMREWGIAWGQNAEHVMMWIIHDKMI